MLHATPSSVPIEESSETVILLAADTAVVSTTIVMAPAAIVTLPAEATPHSAGEALDAHTPVFVSPELFRKRKPEDDLAPLNMPPILFPRTLLFSAVMLR